jgi:hypothetical protein
VPTVRRLKHTVRRLVSGTLFATDATSENKNFNEINDLRAAASAAKSLIYKAFFFFAAPFLSRIVPTSPLCETVS